MTKVIIACGDSREISVDSQLHYSEDRLVVRPNEKYEFVVASGSRWKDLFIWSSANGFINPLAWISGIRVKGVKCFCLCGTYGERDDKAFRIGTHSTRAFTEEGEICFFANDAWNYYDNNEGIIQLRIIRIA